MSTYPLRLTDEDILVALGYPRPDYTRDELTGKQWDEIEQARKVERAALRNVADRIMEQRDLPRVSPLRALAESLRAVTESV